ncbi:MAG: carboxymuconolactone decarboxylase family protein [Eubacteriales bacterium]
MDDIKNKAEKLIAKMIEDRGYIYPEWEFAARSDPDFVEAYNNLYRSALNDGRALSAKTRELIAIGILSFKGNANAVKAHIQRAMRLGATKQEIFEAVETSIIPGGAPTFYCGLSAILMVLNEAKKE